MQPRRYSNSVDSIVLIRPPEQSTPKKRNVRNDGRVARILAMIVLMVAGACCATTVSAQVPPLLQPTNPETHIGKIIFTELITPDLNMAKQFYGGLFGWTFQTTKVGDSDYAQAFMNGYPVAGLIQKTLSNTENRQSAWLTFISTGDVDATKTIALKHGAKLLSEPRNVPNRGRQAVFADPQGAVFAILASTSGDPADSLAEPGEWIWSSLISSDPDNGAGFYQTLFNYEIFELPAPAGEEHLLFASKSYARASANSLPSNGLNHHSHWLNYARVVDATAMTAKVVALGGHILLEPRTDRHGGKVAIVSDPAGAPFGLLEWLGNDMKETPK